jgi:hypothetical protein
MTSWYFASAMGLFSLACFAMQARELRRPRSAEFIGLERFE